MKKPIHQLKILLLQIRDDKETMMEELYEFIQFSGLREEQFEVLNTFITKDFAAEIIDDFDALFIGGSSDASVLKPEEFVFLADCRLLLRRCYNNNIPVFASCFGFQLLVQELGGAVVLDEARMEMGTYAMQLTEAAKEDPLFYDAPDGFYAVSGHKERADKLPIDAINLVYTQECPFHAIKIKDKPIYGFQFHPEIDTKDFVTRITRYQNKYLAEAQALETIKQNAHPDTKWSNALVRNFIERILL